VTDTNATALDKALEALVAFQIRASDQQATRCDGAAHRTS
jgi:hypothetical protein